MLRTAATMLLSSSVGGALSVLLEVETARLIFGGLLFALLVSTFETRMRVLAIERKLHLAPVATSDDAVSAIVDQVLKHLKKE